MHNQPREPQPYEDCQANRFKNLGELHKEWTEAWVKASRATTHRRVKEFGYSCRQRASTWAKEKKNWTVAQVIQSPLFRWEQVLYSFGNQGPRVWRKGGEAHSPSCWKSSVKFQSLGWFGVQCNLLVLVHCVFWKLTSLHPFIKKFWSTSWFLLLTSFLKMLISFPAGFGTCPHRQKLVKMNMVLVSLTGQQTHQTWTP